jgi:hypothetical protein
MNFQIPLGDVRLSEDLQLEHYRKYEMFIEPEERTMIHESNMIPSVHTPLFTCRYFVLI